MNMANRTKNDTIRCKYFRWKLRQRGGVLTADGRTNRPNVGRHSLGTKESDEAMRRLEHLDRVKAVEFGLADREILNTSTNAKIGLDEGWKLYDEHLRRPEVAGGANRKTRQRYRAVFDKFSEFATRRGSGYWNDVTARLISSYLTELNKRGYADRSLYFEGILLKQVMRWLIGEGLVPADCQVKLPLQKVRGTSTHCWTRAEVDAMIDHCRQNPAMEWLGDLIIGLSHSGVRISELAALRVDDVDLVHNIIRVVNDAPSCGKAPKQRRRTKNRRDRAIPIHPNLRPVLARLTARDNDTLFRGPRGGRLKPDTVRVILIRDVIHPLKARFPTPPGQRGFEHGRLHSFRHYFCSTAVVAGIPQATLMLWLGHLDSAMIRHYFHLHDAESRRQMATLIFAGAAVGDGAAEQTPDSPETSSSEEVVREDRRPR